MIVNWLGLHKNDVVYDTYMCINEHAVVELLTYCTKMMAP